jgi:hypothetical protein
MTTETHFAMRLRERAGIKDAAAVYQDLRIALANPEQYPDYLDFVMKAPDGKDIWRVKLETGRFYIIAAGTYPVTVYTQHHMRRAKENRRRKKGR